MFKKISVWYKNLAPKKKLKTVLIFNFAYWFMGLFPFAYFIREVNSSWLLFILFAFLQAFFMTLLFEWRLIKKILKGNVN